MEGDLEPCVISPDGGQLHRQVQGSALNCMQMQFTLEELQKVAENSDSIWSQNQLYC